MRLSYSNRLLEMFTEVSHWHWHCKSSLHVFRLAFFGCLSASSRSSRRFEWPLCFPSPSLPSGPARKETLMLCIHQLVSYIFLTASIFETSLFFAQWCCRQTRTTTDQLEPIALPAHGNCTTVTRAFRIKQVYRTRSHRNGPSLQQTKFWSKWSCLWLQIWKKTELTTFCGTPSAW